jgi:hypothetical protein
MYTCKSSEKSEENSIKVEVIVQKLSSIGLRKKVLDAINS